MHVVNVFGLRTVPDLVLVMISDLQGRRGRSAGVARGTEKGERGEEAEMEGREKEGRKWRERGRGEREKGDGERGRASREKLIKKCYTLNLVCIRELCNRVANTDQY
jgi:hypothetical protein